MARLHFVAKARKDNSVVKKGQPYWWWKTRITVGKSYISRMHYSAIRPRPSQMATSEFKASVLAIQEAIEDLKPNEDLGSELESIISDIQSIVDETQSKLDNMPENLQDGPTGQTLQERIENLENALNNLEDIDCNVDEDAKREEATEAGEDPDEAVEAAYQEILDNITDISIPED